MIGNLFRVLLFLQIVIFSLLEYGGLKRLRITEFGESGDLETWNTIVGLLNIGFSITYLAAVFISARSRQLLGIKPWPRRFVHLGMAITWPMVIWLIYGVLFSYPAS